MAGPVIEVRGLYKKFGQSLRSALKYGLIDAARRGVGLDSDSARLRPGEFWALRDVGFEVRPGEALGIMGVNGSGKTTLLRVLNGTYGPDAGRVTMRGRVGALIAAGAGFDPMLTGRENILINGALVGMSPREIRRRFDEIVDFAELREFIDMPVRNYSSGMAVRLGFSVAVAGRPEILLVDEVLAVGDMNFQRKCFERILELRRGGTAILLVSHSIGSIWTICTGGLFIERGVSSGVIDVAEAARRYGDANARRAAVSLVEESRELGDDDPLPSDYGGPIGGTGEARIRSVEVRALDGAGRATGVAADEIEFGAGLALKMRLRVDQTIDDVMVKFTFDSVHYKFVSDLDSSYCDGPGLIELAPGEYEIEAVVPSQNFRPGAYAVSAGVTRRGQGVHVSYMMSAASFSVRHPRDRFLVDADSPAVMALEATYAIERAAAPVAQESGA